MASLVPQEAASAGGLDFSATYESSLSKGTLGRVEPGALGTLSKDQLTGILARAQQQTNEVEAENRLLRDELYRLRAHLENERCGFAVCHDYRGARARAVVLVRLSADRRCS